MSLLRAQSLDNTTPDPFAIDRVLLSEDDSLSRERVASKISGVTGSSTPDSETPTVAVWLRRGELVARVLCTEKDRAGRGAPIVGYFQTDEISNVHEVATDDIQWFAQAIGRTIPHERLDELRLAIENAYKKKARETALAVAVLLAIFGLVAWLTLRPD